MATREELIEMLRKGRVAEFQQARPYPNVDLYRASLRLVEFPSSLSFGGADLKRADLSDSKSSYAIFTRADLRDTNFSGAYLWGARFEDADLTWAIFQNTNLRSADFYNANLRGVDFRGSDLRDANLKGARNLESANFHGANLWGVKGLPAEIKEQLISQLQRSLRE